MFGRRATDESATPESTTAASATVAGAESSSAQTQKEATAPKGRPTPSRKEAEAARKQAIRVPRDPKAAKAAERERAREGRIKQQEALRGGDERYLPVRDQGPVKKFARDWVDSRFQLASYFLPLALLILLTGFLKLPVKTANTVRSIETALLLGMILTTLITYFLVNSALKKQFPDPVDRKGAAWYATMRSAMPKRFRQPKPTVRAGGAPVAQKAPKESKAPKD
jgi:hypothetical protein